ncbi:hypothetical protein [Oceanobacillus sp. FSL W7-1293]|uniref:hypothetical protein n=1 Tax=Oceanobacillus sp. FSL W7-1293 TaxID=2921699 RepID=UPI0030CD3147
MDGKEKSMDKEIEYRVKKIEADDYDYGPALNKNDVIAMIIVSVICVFGLIWGVM